MSRDARRVDDRFSRCYNELSNQANTERICIYLIQMQKRVRGLHLGPPYSDSGANQDILVIDLNSIWDAYIVLLQMAQEMPIKLPPLQQPFAT